MSAFTGYDDRQPPQDAFRAKSPEYMEAFYRYSDATTKENLARLMSFNKTLEDAMRDSEERRVAYEQQETRRDRTPGTFSFGRYCECCEDMTLPLKNICAVCGHVYPAVNGTYPREPHTQYDHERACGNYTDDEVADMRHPTF